MAKSVGLAILLGAGLLQAQESIHISPSQDQTASTQGGPGTLDPEHYSARGYSMRALLCFAYVIADCKSEIAGDEGLLDTRRYDVEAKTPRGTTREQFHILLQYIVKSRVQDEGYDLVIADGEPKLTVRSGFSSKARVELVAVIAIVVFLCLVVGYLAVSQLRRRPIVPATPA